jgi:hypothetical protein
MTDTTVMLEGPAEVYGRLLEGWGRKLALLEWLLQEDRWHKVGPGFDDVNAFLSSLGLDTIRKAAAGRDLAEGQELQ